MAQPETARAADPGLVSRLLARRAARGDKRAFEQIYRRYHQELFRYCRALTRSDADAEDALQATMASALRSLPGERRQIDIKPWLYRVAHNESISIIRARKETLPGEDLPELHGPGADVDAEQRERLRTLVADLEALPERQRGALVMRELSGLDYDEIGSALETSGGAARQIVYEARLALQARSEGRAMDCEGIREAISAGDRRRLRGRVVKAHLAACPGCADFKAAIDQRSSDLKLISPPLPAAAGAGILAGLLGSSQGGAGLGAAGAGAGASAMGIGSGVATKALSLAAAGAVAVGAGQAAGVDLPGPLGGSDDRQTVETGNPAAPGTPGAGDAAAGSGARPGRPGSAKGQAGERGKQAGRRKNEQGSGAGNGKGRGNGKGKGKAHGKNGTQPSPPAGSNGTPSHGTGKPESPGASGSAPGQSGSAPAGSKSQGNGGGGSGAPSTAPGGSGSASGQPKQPGSSGQGNPGSSSKPETPPGQAKKPSS